MKRTLPLVSLLALVTVDLPGQRGGGRRGGSDRDGARVELEHFAFETVEPEGIETDVAGVRLGVYLPAGYGDEAAAERRYPLAIWLHGRNENHLKFHVDGGARVLDELRGEDAIPEMVFVSLSVGRSPVYVDGSAAGAQEKLIVEQLPKMLAARYRLRDDRGGRALMGVSMGGFGALKIALRHPEVFGVVAAHSSALMPADPTELPPQYARMVDRMLQRAGLDQVFGNPIDADKWAAEMPLALAASMPVDTLGSLRIYFDAGSDDRYGFAPPNQELHDVLARREVAHAFELVEGGGHSWGSGSLQQQLRKSLRFVGEAFRQPVPAREGEPAAATRGSGR